MKLKAIVGIALVISLLVIGNILLFGLVSGSHAVLTHVLFTFALFMIVFFMLRGVLRGVGEFVAVFVIVILIAVLMFPFSSAVRTYQQASASIPSDDIQSQIVALENTNQYYGEYIAYLNAEIQKSQANIVMLEGELTTALLEQRNASQDAPAIQPPVAPPAVVPVVPPEVPPPREYEREDDDD